MSDTLSAFDAAAANAAAPAASAPSPQPPSTLAAFDAAHAAVQGAPAGQPPSAAAAAVSAPMFGLPLDSNTSDMFSAMGHHAMSGLHGAAQLIEHGIGSAAHAVAPGSAVDSAISADNQNNDQALADREKQYQASTPNSAGAYTGAALGEVAPLLAGGGSNLTKIGDFVGGGVSKLATQLGSYVSKIAPYLGRVASAGTQGGIIGGVQPVTTPTAPTSPSLSDVVTGDTSLPNFWTQKATQIGTGAASGAGFQAIGAPVIGAAANVFKPFTNPGSIVAGSLRNWAGDLTKTPEQFVPGSFPTTAQANPTPALVQAENVLRNDPRSSPAFVQRANDNNAARLAVLDQHSNLPAPGEVDPLDTAIAARTTNSQPYIDSLVNAPGVPVAPLLAQIDSVANSALGTDPIVSRGLTSLRASIASRAVSPAADGASATASAGGVATGAQPTDPGTIRPDLLDGIRQNVRQFLVDNSSTGAVSTKQEAALAPIKSAFGRAIEQANPGYFDYLAQYARDSVPINSMEAARQLAGPLGLRALNTGGDPSLTLPTFNAALRKAASQEYGLSPDAQSAFEGVQKDLQRASTSNAGQPPGSNTAFNVQAPDWLSSALFGPTYGGKSPIAPALGAGLGAGAGWLMGEGPLGLGTAATTGMFAANKLSQTAGGRVNSALADALLNPTKAYALTQAAGAPARGIFSRLPSMVQVVPQAATNSSR